MENSQKIYSQSGVRLATFLGGPLAGTILISSNFTTLENHEMAIKSMYIGCFVTVTMLMVLLSIPDNVSERFPSYVLPLIFMGIAQFIMEKYQKDNIKEYVSNGGVLFSNWRALGFSLLYAMATLAMGLVFFLIMDIF